MNTKTMEGLVGARTNMNLANTPMRFFREARRKGDTETMKRAMGYADEFSVKAEEYQAKADKGMGEDAKEAREKAKLQREEAIRMRREEREKLEKLEEKTAENRKTDADTAAKETGACVLEVSEEGKVLLKENADLDSAGSGEIKADAPKEPVTYTKTGETVPAIQEASISVSVWSDMWRRAVFKLPDTYTIFITEKDFFGEGKPIYQIERNNLTTSKPFADGEHILYVNGEYRGDSEIGKLMHDFNCTSEDDMIFALMAERTKYLKENPKGVSEMCKAMEDMRNQTLREGMIAVTLRMLEDGEYTLEKIADLPLDEVKKLCANKKV